MPRSLLRCLGMGVCFLLSAACSAEPESTLAPTLAPTAQPPPSSATPVPATVTAAPAAVNPSPTVPATAEPSVRTEDPIAHLASGEPLTIKTLHMLDATTGWAVGQSETDPNDHILLTSDGGATWNDVTPPEPLDPAAPLGKGATAFFLNSDEAWATYYDRTAPPIAEPATVWRTQDAGQTWTLSRPLDMGDIAEFYSPSDLVFVDSQTGWLMVHIGAGMSHDYVMIFSSHDGGQTWERIVDPDKDNLPMSCGKNGLAFRDAHTGWVAGDCGGVVSGLYLQQTMDGGTTWQAVELPPPAEASDLFTSETVACGATPPIFTSDRNGAFTVGCTYFDPPQAKGWLYLTTDAGQTWTSQPLPTAYGSLEFVNDRLGWWVGNDDPNQAEYQLYQTQEGGQTWTPLKTLNWAGQMEFISEQEGWAVAQAGDAVALVHTTDGGATWQEIKPRVVGP